MNPFPPPPPCSAAGRMAAAPRRPRLLCAVAACAVFIVVHAAGASPDAAALPDAALDAAESSPSSLITTGAAAASAALWVPSSGPQQQLHVAVRVAHPAPADARCVSVRPVQGVLAVRPVAVTDPSPVYLPGCAPQDTKLRGFQQPCYRTCALVGSSGVLGNSSWGDKIDGSHQAVIRLNNAPVVGFEADVGARTTVRIIHDAHLTTANINKLAATTSDGFTVMWPPRKRPNSTRTGGPTPRFGDVSTFLEEYAYRKRRACAPMLRYSPEAYAEVYRLSGLLVGRYPPVVPSTGFLAVVTALQLCRKVTVFGLSWGMAPATARRWRRSHSKGDHKPTYYYRKKNQISGADSGVTDNETLYYDRVRSFGFTHHDLDAEKGALSSLARAHSLEFL